jgi:hypothetical protein
VAAYTQAGQELHDRIKANLLLFHGSYIAPFCGFVPLMCIENGRLRKVKLMAKKSSRQQNFEIWSLTSGVSIVKVSGAEVVERLDIGEGNHGNVDGGERLELDH